MPIRMLAAMVHRAAAAAYGAKLRALQELKTTYDPDNFFHASVNIRPR